MHAPHFHAPGGTSRRAFLRRGGALSLAAGAAPWALSLAALGEAAAQDATDYKALVCVFLYGGNDYANTLVPYDEASHAAYRSFRANIALDRAALGATALTPATPLAGGVQYALAPGLAPLVPVFDAGRMAVVLNVGTLVQPTTKAQYRDRSVRLPPKLFSHNDQQSYWQASLPEGAATGWGGRIGDLFAAGNGTSTFTCISVTGNAVFLSGRTAIQYQVGSNGALSIDALRQPLYGSAACSAALRTLVTQSRTQWFEDDYARVTARAVDSNERIAAALESAQVATAFPANGLGNQLRTVARLIASRQALGAKRQVFFVSIGGFDTHDSILQTHPGLMASLGSGLAAFDQAMTELGVQQQVTTFTASDFGRTLLSNTDGSDHGWGGMHFVMGGAVRGRGYVGTPPALGDNGPDDVGQGRLLPAIAVEQYAATLAGWMGASPGAQRDVMPNLANFSTTDLGFLVPAAAGA